MPKCLILTLYRESCNKRLLSSETSHAIITEEWMFNGLINYVRDEHCHFSQLSSWNESTLTHWLLARICCTTESSRQHAARGHAEKKYYSLLGQTKWSQLTYKNTPHTPTHTLSVLKSSFLNWQSGVLYDKTPSCILMQRYPLTISSWLFYMLGKSAMFGGLESGIRCNYWHSHFSPLISPAWKKKVPHFTVTDLSLKAPIIV